MEGLKLENYIHKILLLRSLDIDVHKNENYELIIIDNLVFLTIFWSKIHSSFGNLSAFIFSSLQRAFAIVCQFPSPIFAIIILLT